MSKSNFLNNERFEFINVSQNEPHTASYNMY